MLEIIARGAFSGLRVMRVYGSGMGACQKFIAIPFHVFLAGVCEVVISQVRHQKVSIRRGEFGSFGILRI